MAVAIAGIRILTFVTAVAVAATSCASGGGGSSAASCAATLRFRHQVYVGTSLRIHPPINRTYVIPKFHLHTIGIAVQPPCLDTNHPGANDTPAPVQVARIDKVSPKIAVAALPKGNVYVVRGAKIPRILTTAR